MPWIIQTAVMQFNTVRDLLDRLIKFASQIVEYPNGYTIRSKFTTALNEPLRHEVFLDGLMPEFSSLAELLSAAERIETPCNTSCMVYSSNFAAPPDSIPSEEYDQWFNQLQLHELWLKATVDPTIDHTDRTPVCIQRWWKPPLAPLT